MRKPLQIQLAPRPTLQNPRTACEEPVRDLPSGSRIPSRMRKLSPGKEQHHDKAWDW